MKHYKNILAATLLSATTFSAHALETETIIDFENQSTSTGLGGQFTVLTIENVTFSGSDVSGDPANFFFSDTGSITELDFSGKFLMNGIVGFTTLTFSFADAVNQFSFNLGDNQHDWELTGFDSLGTSIGSLTIDRLAPDTYSNNGALFGLSSQNFDISYATLVMGSGPVTLIPVTDVIEFDNLKYTTNAVSPVPEPATYALMLGGLGMVGFMAYRRRKAVNT